MSSNNEWFDKNGFQTTQKKLSDKEVALQKKFIKKIGKSKAKVKMPVTKGNL